MKITKFNKKYVAAISKIISINKEEILEKLDMMENGIEYGKFHGAARSIIAGYCINKMDSNYDSEKSLDEVTFDFCVSNGYVPVRSLSNSKEIVMIVSSETMIGEDDKVRRFKDLPLENQSTYSIKAHMLKEINISESQIRFQDNKARNTLEIKSVPDSIMSLYSKLKFLENKSALKNESRFAFKARLNAEAEDIKEYFGVQFNNYSKYASHGRNYSLVSLITGDKFLASLVQSSEYHTITKDNIDTLKFWLYVNVVSKATKSEALEKYDGRSISAIVKRLSKSLKGETTISSLGKAMRMIEAYNIIKNGVGFKTKFLPDFDGVNYGLVSFANNIRTKELLDLANLSSNDRVDSHTVFQNAFNMKTRDEAKKLTTPYIHGASLNSMAKSSNKSIEETTELCKSILGESYNIPNIIAEFGKAIHAKGNSIIEFTSPSGYSSIQSVGYTKKTRINLSSNGYEFHAFRDMPVLRGFPTAHVAEKASGSKDVKVNGLFAVICHALDNHYLEDLYEKDLIQYDKFDAYYGWNDEKVINTVFESLKNTQNYIKETISYLSNKYHVTEPVISYGSEVSTNSMNFIAP